MGETVAEEPELGPETRPDLFPNTKSWDEKQREEYYKQYLPLISKTVSRFLSNQTDLDVLLEDQDLFQLASVAFYKAYDHYEPTHGAQFLTYAISLMQNELKMAFRSANKQSRKPLYPMVPFYSYEDEMGEDHFGINDTFSYYKGDIWDNHSIESVYAREEVLDYIYELLEKRFSERERTIFLAISGKEMTQIDLAEKFGITQSYVCRLYKLTLVSLNYELEKAGFLDSGTF